MNLDVFDVELEVSSAPEDIFFNRKTYVEGFAFAYFAVVIGLLEGYGRYHGFRVCGVAYGKLDVFFAGTNQPGASVVRYVSCNKNRREVARTERLKLLEYPEKLLGNLSKVHLGIDIDMRGELVLGDGLFDNVLETSFKIRYVVDIECQPGSIGMASKIFQQIVAGIQGLVDIEAWDGTGRAGCHAIGGGEYDGGTVINLDHPRGHNAYYTFMPAGIIEDSGFLFPESGLLGNHLQGVLRDITIDVFTRVVT